MLDRLDQFCTQFERCDDVLGAPSSDRPNRERIPQRKRHAMEYKFTQGDPITEQEALDQTAAMGLHGLAFDDTHDDDETLHWHEFESVAFVISGTGSFADEHGNVTHTQPGCRLQAPAGWLHRTLAGSAARIVIGTNLPYDEWTMPIDKDPRRPARWAGDLTDERAPSPVCPTTPRATARTTHRGPR